YEAQLTLHEAALPPPPRLRRTRRAMKRSLTASCFLPWNQGKKMVGVVLIVRKTSLKLKMVAS
ncbi:MAG: hypothetical protein J6T08_00565, partial [Lentisphaeria bacterium]|nr:hypothetical protein [Lentisphaeria bacterium]